MVSRDRLTILSFEITSCLEHNVSLDDTFENNYTSAQRLDVKYRG